MFFEKFSESWITTAKNDSAKKLRRTDSEVALLTFEIVSTRTVEDSSDKKHVVRFFYHLCSPFFYVQLF